MKETCECGETFEVTPGVPITIQHCTPGAVTFDSVVMVACIRCGKESTYHPGVPVPVKHFCGGKLFILTRVEEMKEEPPPVGEVGEPTTRPEIISLEGGDPQSTDREAEIEEELNKLKVAELKILAQNAGIKNTKDMNKKTLIMLLKGTMNV